MKYKFGHWESDIELNSEESFGFIYRVINTTDGRQYIGKKQYWFYKKSKKLKPSGWQTYTGSSKDLNSDIKKIGKDKFKFCIVAECVTRGWLSYLESNYLHKENALTEWINDDTRLYYNKQIGATRYVPKRVDNNIPVPRKKK